MNTTTHNTPPGLGQWALAITFLGIAVAGSLVSFYLNITFGWQLYAEIGAAAFAIAELGLFAIPFTQTTMGWNPRRRTAWAICLGMSLIAASAHLLEMSEQRINDADAISETARGSRSDESRLRRELDAIAETGDVASLQARLDAAKKLAGEATATAKAAGIGCDQRKVCVAAAGKVDAIQAQLGAAKRRDELTARLNTASAKVEAAPAEKAIMGAGTISKLTGIDKGAIASSVSTVMMICIILVLVMASGFSGDAGRMLAECINQRKAARAAAFIPAKPVKAVAPAPVQPVTRKDEALLRLQMMCFNAPGGVLIGSRNAIWSAWKADGFIVGRTAFYDWLTEWETAGLIEVKDNGRNSSEIRAHRIAVAA